MPSLPASPAAVSSPVNPASSRVAGSIEPSRPASPGSRGTGRPTRAASTDSRRATTSSGTDGAVAADRVRCSVGGTPPNDSCGCTNQPRSSISSATVNTSHESSATRATRVESGATSTLRPRMPSTAVATASVASRACRASSAYPCDADPLGHRPGGGERPTGAGRLHRAVEHRVAGPVRRGEEVAPPQRRRAVQQHRHTLGRVGVLVQVDADAGDAVDREGPRRGVEVRQHPAADTGVDVAADAARRGQRRDLRHRVDDAVGVGGRRGDDEHGRVVDGIRHGAPGRRATSRGRRRPARRAPPGTPPPCGTQRAPSLG